ncbi:NAD(P)H-binding protein [Spirosoma areae]
MNTPTLLIGATAGTGYEVARSLLTARQPIRIIARNREKARKLFGQTPAEVVISDLTAPNEAFYRAFEGVGTIIFTAGVPAGFAREKQIQTVDYGGIVAALDAAQKARFRGRFVYMTTIGLHHRTFWIRLLNLIKPNLIHWRLEAERAIQQSGLTYTIVRAGLLTNKPAGRKPIQLMQADISVRLSTQISRADVAGVLLTIARMETAQNQTYSAIWGGDGSSVVEQIDQLAR